MLMKLTPVVNLINVFPKNFTYESSFKANSKQRKDVFTKNAHVKR